ncbi:MAG: tRNA uridine-5-carboxymethylaminomethyl(34) synthesis GTPase MnmE [Gammaproteobacteria bacterium]|nr:tRNA uridine-5-carboxymethylaminomethyl(34) synthesis GTPase MnmE [Gammaproteobacteria bacterium]MYF67832.1 tRNA uridine-5-carboxymethylaminomethyl(34) synthesis GTPase MnmE [Gammaproteobacteria bacterium]MYK37885.1 tRNA uridine-5-carboxymethylaminomethyl(34) synthesis GTPase MnmE [Gammaproteobacteria bacterium]
MADQSPDRQGAREAGGTIVACATPPGRGGVAVLRVSGDAVRAMAAEILGEVPPARSACLVSITDSSGELIDRGLALFFPAPNSFTGEDVLELQVHGSPMVCDLLTARICELGARPAGPGEFSRRAFLNDRMDLAQAEAVADLIDASSAAAARAAARSLRGAFSEAVEALVSRLTGLRAHLEATLDFPDEEVNPLEDSALKEGFEELGRRFGRVSEAAERGRILRDGLNVVISGRPNAGKSSLLNALAGEPAAIVADEPGTTRDLVRAEISIDGIPVELIDTAGLRSAEGGVEREGVRRARAARDEADLVLDVWDAAAGGPQPRPAGRTIVVRNKIDLTGEAPGGAGDGTVSLSARTGAGLDSLRRILAGAAGGTAEGVFSARSRQINSLKEANRRFLAAGSLFGKGHSAELVAEELRLAQEHLGEITGAVGSDDLLGEIFSQFCIGK